MTDIDVTDKVQRGPEVGEMVPLLRCVCGRYFARWHFNLSSHREFTNPCPQCGRKFYYDGPGVMEIQE